jgi:anaerobic magnesium-protoporphyrin IX monomethyl ester cyclase
MKILLINPPHPAIGSRIPHEHLPPLGLLALGGPLLDAGHAVKLLDADLDDQPVSRIVWAAREFAPDAVLLGHSGSTSGHPSAMKIARAVGRALPRAWIIYGGVFPTYHWPQIMAQEPVLDFIVRGEGEETIVRLISALAHQRSVENVRGVVFRSGRSGPGPRPAALDGRVVCNPPAPVIRDLDACRTGWELIDHGQYTYYGHRRAVVAQFSRGCPHHCNYCGQHDFWRTWRHRDPVKFAAELARLHREHGVEVINFADENPTASRPAWRALLEALIAENVPLILIGTTRAGDIVRDADLLPLYKRAGVERLLLGLESTDDATLRAIHKDSTRAADREAVRLMRRHGIISMAAWVAGLVRERDGDYWRTLKQLLACDPDQIQALFATPHGWTPFAVQEADHRVIQTDLSRWDYKHQVLASARVPAWRVLLWVKGIEAVCQLRPRALWRLLAHPDPRFRAGMRWYSNIGRRVWLHEIWQWLWHDRRTNRGPVLREFLRGGWKYERPAVPRSGDRPRPAPDLPREVAAHFANSGG